MKTLNLSFGVRRLGFDTLPPGFIIGLRWIAEGVKAFEAKSQSTLVISLCGRIMSPPAVLHLRALQMLIFWILGVAQQ
jgi:hypothetical protein